MSDVVFILGAGASRDCGAPLMIDFLDTAARLLSTGEVEAKKDHFVRVFKAVSSLQAVHSKSQLDLNNIESIFTALEIANVLGKLPGFEKADQWGQTRLILYLVLGLKGTHLFSFAETIRTLDFKQRAGAMPTRCCLSFPVPVVNPGPSSSR